MRFRNVFAVVGAAGLAVTACSDDSADDDQTEASTSSTDGGDAQESPLAEYMPGMDFSGNGMVSHSVSVGGPQTSEQDRQDFRRVQEAIAECMREEGFEYVPMSLDDMGSSRHHDAFSLEPEEFAEEYGYGISTLTFDADEEEQETNDPNEEIRDGLSEAAKKAYDAALWGDLDAVMGSRESGEAAISSDDMPSDPQDMGCQGKGSAEVHGEQQEHSADPTDFSSLFDDVFALQERITNDPRVAAAAEEWSQYMAEAGHSGYETPGDPQAEIIDEFIALQGGGEDGASDSAVIAGPGGGSAADIDPEKLAELREREVEVATADYACRQDHYEEIHREVAFEMEQEFIDDNRAALERYRDWAAESGGNA